MKIFNLLLFCLIGQFAIGQYYYLGSAGQVPGNLNNEDTYPVGGGQAAGWTSLVGPSATTPVWSANQTLPFTFNFNGAPVTDYKISSTGVLTFDVAATTVPGATPMALPDASVPDNSICLWGLNASGANDNGSIKVFGTAPNRQLWIHYSSVVNGTIDWSYYSIVLEETTDRIYLVDQRNTTGVGALSAGVQINSTTAYSVAGSPALGAIASTDATPADDYYYEFIQGVQPADESQLIDFDLLPYVANGSVDIIGTVKNLGSNTITSLDVTWDDGSGPNTSTLTGLSIATNTNYTFTHPTTLSATVSQSYTIDLVAATTGDIDATNNTIQKSTATLSAIPTKYVVGEEKTGTWCGWCPRGAVGLAGMEATAEFIGIAVHNGDPMTVAAYDSNIGTYVPGGYPGGGVDRVIDGDPSQFSAMHAARVGDVVPCSVNDITTSYNATTNEIEVSTDVEFFGTISGNYRLSLVVLEDDLIQTGANWSQTNYYAGGGSGVLTDPVTGFSWDGAASSVNPTLFGGYDHVARYLSNNDILGEAGSLPAGSVPAGVHSYTFANIPAATVNLVSNSHYVVMVINADNGEILNAGKTEVELPTEVALTDFNLPQLLPFGNSDIIGTVENKGTTDITSLDVTWNDGSGPNTSTLTGLTIVPGATYTFTHPTQLAVTPGTTYSITLTATVTGDVDAANNSITKVGTVPSDLSVGDAVNAFEFNIYPNPTKGQMILELNANDSKEVSYFVTDAIGNVVISNNITSVTAGQNIIKLDGERLANGMYFVHVKAGDSVITKKVNIIK
ncbi:hypothetical protein DNU06_02675 [Putridiphycobacter roseus]|uniref:Secretion system C-terminal sorting domain-containing protein n=1 Tax=Putridiphycobacter roseus TaxID=2219161 RepID=A0A2W1N6I8_9FLAO|nr:T9SS type A sorting domain-containing protein [Putridiphycobacter roseus]PZE18751.1 hypothetical protein DNU06_02675 [Putridiphycobacter roseus]